MTKVASSQNLAIVELDVTVEAAAYATGDLIGGKLSLALPDWFATGAAGFLIQSVSVVDQAKQSVALDIVFFNADPSGTTFTENAALDIADADMAKIAGYAQVLSYAAFNDNSFGQAQNLAIPVATVEDGQTLYAAIVSRGAPTFAATTDVKLRVGILKF